MFDDSRHGAQLLFNRIEHLAAGHPIPVTSSLQDLGA
jgi:hypothetical protein